MAHAGPYDANGEPIDDFCGGTNPRYHWKGDVLKLDFSWITDGLSNTIMVGEKHVLPDGFGKISDYDTAYWDDMWSQIRSAGPGHALARFPDDDSNVLCFGSYHPGICQFVLCDASVRSINVSINTTILGYLAQRDDGQIISSNAW